MRFILHFFTYFSFACSLLTVQGHAEEPHKIKIYLDQLGLTPVPVDVKSGTQLAINQLPCFYDPSSRITILKICAPYPLEMDEGSWKELHKFIFESPVQKLASWDSQFASTGVISTLIIDPKAKDPNFAWYKDPDVVLRTMLEKKKAKKPIVTPASAYLVLPTELKEYAVTQEGENVSFLELFQYIKDLSEEAPWSLRKLKSWIFTQGASDWQVALQSTDSTETFKYKYPAQVAGVNRDQLLPDEKLLIFGTVPVPEKPDIPAVTGLAIPHFAKEFKNCKECQKYWDETLHMSIQKAREIASGACSNKKNEFQENITFYETHAMATYRDLTIVSSSLNMPISDESPEGKLQFYDKFCDKPCRPEGVCFHFIQTIGLASFLPTAPFNPKDYSNAACMTFMIKMGDQHTVIDTKAIHLPKEEIDACEWGGLMNCQKLLQGVETSDLRKNLFEEMKTLRAWQMVYADCSSKNWQEPQNFQDAQDNQDTQNTTSPAISVPAQDPPPDTVPADPVHSTRANSRD